MKISSIFISLLFILILSCDKNPSTSTPEDTNQNDDINIQEPDYSICENCIWLQNSCDGNWVVGYNVDSSIGGFQFTIDDASIIEITSGDAVLNAGFSISSSTSTILGFSMGGNSMQPGSGELMVLNLQGNPSALSNIVFSNSEAESIDIVFHGVFNCYYSSLNTTGNSQLTIFKDSITNLEIGDEIGIFDSNAILNYGDCSEQKGELLVGSGIWDGNQLNIVSTGSVDLCNFDGVQLAGFVEGNEVVVRVWKADEQLEYEAVLTWSTGTGVFGDVLQSVSNINLVNSSLSKGLF